MLKRSSPSRHPINAWLIAAAAMTSSWTNVSIGGVLKLSDLLVLMALLFALPRVFAERKYHTLLLWSFAPVVAWAIVLVYQVVVRNAGPMEGMTDILRAFFGLSAVVLLSFSLIDEDGARSRFVIKAWVLGVGLNASMVVAAEVGLFRPAVGHAAGIDSDVRAIGLAFHPNSLAFSIVVALPVVCLIAFYYSKAISRAFWLIVIGILIYALFSADSRAGIGIGLGVLAVCLLVTFFRSRFRIMIIPMVILAAIAFAVWLVPFITSSTRLASGAGDLSDAGRSIFNAEGLLRFSGSPWFGVGFDNAIGTSMFIHLLSETGIIGALGYLIFLITVIAALLRFAPSSARIFALLSVLAGLAFGVFQPGLTERATYWGAMLIVAIGVSRAVRPVRESFDKRRDEGGAGS